MHIGNIICLQYLQHKNQMVNDQLLNELQTYGDIQLVPFVDYYNLITWKTVAICTFGVRSHFLEEVKKGCLVGSLCVLTGRSHFSQICHENR